MKKKFNLGDLKVKSFVTSIENDSSQTIAGGSKFPTYRPIGGFCLVDGDVGVIPTRQVPVCKANF